MNVQAKLDKQSNPSGTRRSISTTLSLFAIISTLVLGVMVMGLLSIRIGEAVSHSQLAHANSQIRTLADDIESYLNNREKILTEHASFPIMVQAAMQPDNTRGNLKDFITRLTFLGEIHQQVLLDFSGERVFERLPAPLFNYSQQPWVTELIDATRANYRGISQDDNGRFYWCLAQPVRYNDLVEGLLVTEIPLDELDALLASDHLGGLGLEILWQGQTVKQMGQVSTGVASTLDTQSPDIKLRFTIDTSISQRIRNTLLIENALLLLVLGVIATVASIYLGKRWFVEPIQELQQFARHLADNTATSLQMRDSDMKEIHVLANDFTSMARQIRQRENDLHASHQALSDTHEQLKASQAQLVHTEKMASLGILAAGVAHEINNPVGFIKGNLSSLKNYLDTLMPLLKHQKLISEEGNNPQQSLPLVDPEELAFLIEDIPPLIDDTLEGTERVKKIVSGLKTFVSIGNSEQQAYDLNTCIETTLELIKQNLNHCEIHTDLEPLPALVGSAENINQVIAGLIINASQAIKDSGRITITTNHNSDNQTVQLTISDTGCGIAKEHHEKIYTPFFTTKDTGQGVGLGLSICYGIIENHHGTIEFESEPDKGTTFTINLPVANDDA